MSDDTCADDIHAVEITCVNCSTNLSDEYADELTLTQARLTLWKKRALDVARRMTYTFDDDWPGDPNLYRETVAENVAHEMRSWED